MRASMEGPKESHRLSVYLPPACLSLPQSLCLSVFLSRLSPRQCLDTNLGLTF